MKKQYEHIKKMENKLLETGVAGGELEDLKRNAIRGLTGRRDYEPAEAREEEGIEDRTR